MLPAPLQFVAQDRTEFTPAKILGDVFCPAFITPFHAVDIQVFQYHRIFRISERLGHFMGPVLFLMHVAIVAFGEFAAGFRMIVTPFLRSGDLAVAFLNLVQGLTKEAWVT